MLRGVATRSPVYYGWVILGLGILSTMAAAGMTFWSITVYIPAIVDEFDASRFSVTATFTIGSVVGAMVGPFAGRWMDARGARETVLVGSVAIAAALFVTSQSIELWQIFVGWTVVSAIRPLLFPVPYSWLVTRWFSQRRQMALGVLTVGFGLSGAVSFPFLTSIEDAWGWSAVMISSGFVILIVNGLLALLFIFDRPRDLGLAVENDAEADARAQSSGETGFTVRQALRTRTFWLLSLAFMFLFIGPSAVTTLQLDFFKDEQVSHAVAIISLTALLRGSFRLPLGVLLGRIHRVFALGFVVAISQAIAVVALVLSTGAAGLGAFIVLWTVGGAFVPMLEPVLVSRAFGVRHFGAIMGAVGMVAFWGGLIGPVGGGALRDAMGSYDVAFTLFAIGLLVAGVLFAATGRAVRSRAHLAAATRAGMST